VYTTGRLPQDVVRVSAIHSSYNEQRKSIEQMQFKQLPQMYMGRSQKFILGGYNFLLHDTTVLYTNSLSTSAAIHKIIFRD